MTRYVFENPYPLAGLLVAIALVLGWTALRDGHVKRQSIAGILLVAGAVVLLLGFLVTTPGEHARRVTRAFVNAVVAEDLVAVDRLLAADAALTIGTPANPGVDADAILGKVTWATDAYDISSNRITRLDSRSEGGDDGVVELACWTEVEGGYGPTVTSWILRVTRQDDGAWRIRRLTFVSVNGNPASGDHLR